LTARSRDRLEEMNVAVVKADLAVIAGCHKPAICSKSDAKAVATIVHVPTHLTAIRQVEDAQAVRANQCSGKPCTICAEYQPADNVWQAAQAVEKAARPAVEEIDALGCR
jgi:hypothetical protein